jgi:chromosome segregation ATPase
MDTSAITLIRVIPTLYEEMQQLQERNRSALIVIKTSRDYGLQLERDINALQQVNENLEEENTYLKEECTGLKEESASLKEENSRLMDVIRVLKEGRRRRENSIWQTAFFGWR